MLRNTPGSGVSSGALQQNVSEIIQLLESNNINVIEEITSLVRDTLASTHEPWLINGLVDYYMDSGNIIVRRLLTGIRSPQHKNLLNKIDEYLQKPAMRYSALNIFGHIVRKEPIWIHCIVQSRALATVLKCLQIDKDVAVLTIALYVVSTLIPKVATQIGGSLNILCGIYVRLMTWISVKHSGMSNLNLINFNAALYSLFLCLYGMYPSYFISYLQKHYSPQIDRKAGMASLPDELVISDVEKREIFQNQIVPMLQQVRLHPDLILYPKNSAISNERWKKMESHDIITEISDLRLDLGGSLSVESDHIKPSACRIPSVGKDQVFNIPEAEFPQTSIPLSDELKLTFNSRIWSPSMELGLSTPPPSRSISPTLGNCSDDKFKNDSSECIITNGARRPAAGIGGDDSHSKPYTQIPCKISSHFKEADDLLKSGVFGDNAAYNTTSSKVGESTGTQKQPCIDVMRYGPTNVTQQCSRDDTTVARNYETDEINVTSSADQPITDFSPALQPSAEHSSISNSSVSQIRDLSTHDPSFVHTGSACVNDIFDYRSRRVNTCLSPYEILQREIELSVQNQTQTPGHKDVDWMPFDQGILSESESRILRATVMQLQCALIFEQHERMQHATRARRLMRKIYEISALEEKNKALSHIVVQNETDIKQLHCIIQSQKRESHHQEAKYGNSLQEAHKKIAYLTDTLKATNAENVRLSGEKKNNLEAIENAKATKCATSGMYKYTLQLQSEMKSMQTISELTGQVNRLQQELLTVEELGRKMDAVEKLSTDYTFTEASKYKVLVELYKKESSNLSDKLNDMSVQYDFIHHKVQEIEKLIQKKDRLLEDQKKYLENVKSLARSQIQAMEAKYQAQRSITMRMETQVMELFSGLAAMEGETLSNDSTGHSKPILHPLRFQSRYGHLIGASPELSPPVEAFMLKESSVATSELEASTGTDEA